MSERTYQTANGVTINPGDAVYVYGDWPGKIMRLVTVDDGVCALGSIYVGGGKYIRSSEAWSSWEAFRDATIAGARQHIADVERTIASLEAASDPTHAPVTA
jgi:hypothetical protein